MHEFTFRQQINKLADIIPSSGLSKILLGTGMYFQIFFNTSIKTHGKIKSRWLLFSFTSENICIFDLTKEMYTQNQLESYLKVERKVGFVVCGFRSLAGLISGQ